MHTERLRAGRYLVMDSDEGHVGDVTRTRSGWIARDEWHYGCRACGSRRVRTLPTLRAAAAWLVSPQDGVPCGRQSLGERAAAN